MARHPGGKIFAGAMYGSLYVSNDDGRNWQLSYDFNDGMYLSDVTNICIDSKGTIYASTLPDGGLYKSTDEGNTWNNCTSPVSSNDIFKLTCNENDDLFIGARSGIYQSKDGGLTWSKVLETNGAYVRCIEFKDGKIFATVDQYGLAISGDMGKTWKMYQAPQSAYYSLVVLSDKEFLISMYFDLPFLAQGIYKSIDGGLSWQKVDVDLPVGTWSKLEEKNGIIYFTTYQGGIYRSLDKGESWVELTSGKVGVLVSSMLVENNKLIAGTRGGGVLISTDNGVNWNLSGNGLPEARVRDMLKLQDGTLLIANSAGLFRYYPDEEKYVGINGFNSSEITGMCLTSDNLLFVGTYQGDIVRSSNMGITWTKIVTPVNFAGLFIFEKGYRNNIYVYGMGSHGLYTYNDDSKSWTKSQPDFSMCRTMKIDSDDTLYLAVDKTVFKSSDRGKTWKMLSDIFNSDIWHIDITKKHAIIVSTWQGIFKSCDQGITWKHIPIPEVNRAIKSNGVIELPNGHLVLSTEIGLYESSDGGENWFKRTDEISMMNVKKIIRTEDGHYYAITDQGLYESTEIISDVTEAKLPEQFSLEQNYPNPFNPGTTIKYSVSSVRAEHVQPLHVLLKIFDLLGREVTTLVNEEKSPGNYEVKFDGTNLPSGAYFYRFTSGSFSQTKKMLLMK